MQGLWLMPSPFRRFHSLVCADGIGTVDEIRKTLYGIDRLWTGAYVCMYIMHIGVLAYEVSEDGWASGS